MSNGDQEKSSRFTPEEDEILREYVKKHGEHKWNEIKKHTGINRGEKSCYNRWTHHLKPGLEKGPITDEEEKLIVKLHAELGNQWAKIAKQLPGRTNYSIKKYWELRKERLEREGLPIYPPQVSQQFQNDTQDVGALQTTSQLIPSQAVGDDDLDLFGDYAQYFYGDDDVDPVGDVTESAKKKESKPYVGDDDLDLVGDYVQYFYGDDDVDPFGDVTESAKKKESGKSSVLLDVKPWDNETDMNQLEAAVRSVDMPGLFWGASKVVPVGNGIQKLQIEMNFFEGLVSVDTLIEELLTSEPSNKYIQSCEIVAFDKI